MEVNMLIQAKIQIAEDDYQFIKASHQVLNYKSFSGYVRDAIHVKVREDRKKLRGVLRQRAMEMIGKSAYTHAFESLDGEDFEDR
jgi:hypothetical protein